MAPDARAEVLMSRAPASCHAARGRLLGPSCAVGCRAAPPAPAAVHECSPATAMTGTPAALLLVACPRNLRQCGHRCTVTRLYCLSFATVMCQMCMRRSQCRFPRIPRRRAGLGFSSPWGVGIPEALRHKDRQAAPRSCSVGHARRVLGSWLLSSTRKSNCALYAARLVKQHGKLRKLLLVFQGSMPIVAEHQPRMKACMGTESIGEVQSVLLMVCLQ